VNNGVQQMQTSATNVCNGCEWGATNATATMTGATDADGNKCPKTGGAQDCASGRGMSLTQL